MITAVQPYPTYKPSGVEWLGDVPEHWDVRRTGTIARILNGATPSTGNVDYWDGDIVWITPDDLGKLHGRYIAGSVRRITEHGYRACGTSLAPAGSIAISTRAPIGHLGILSSDACVNQGCRLLMPDTVVETEYLYYALSATTSALASFGQGSTFTELSRTLLAAFRLPLPPLPEQAAIVRFLDHADEQIQRYIAGKERLIALLEEERQALVHQAVTRGLDPNVPLKPSGVEWLGDVPEHWETAQLGSIGRFSKGNGGTKEDEVPVGVPCIRYGDIYTSHKYFIKASRAYIEQEKTSEYTPLRFGDILFAGSGETIEEIGKSAVNLIKEPAYSGGDVIIFRPTVRVNAEFTGYATDSPGAQAQKSIMGRGFTVMHIYGNQLKNIQIALPPIDEQDGIVEHINNGTALIDDTIARSRRQINLMNEYRTRLIADVVTGQLDVRETAAQLEAAP